MSRPAERPGIRVPVTCSSPGLVCCWDCGAWGRLPEFEPLHTEECDQRHLRVCEQCQEPCGPHIPDPCLGMLPGVIFACCGHGENTGYIVFENMVCLRMDRLWAVEVPDQRSPLRSAYELRGEEMYTDV